MHPQHRKHALLTASALAACLVAATVAFAQEKKEEEPFWAKGRPKGDVTAKMAPVAAPPVPTPEAQLPRLTAPPGFKVEVYQSGILDARGLRRGDKGTARPYSSVRRIIEDLQDNILGIIAWLRSIGRRSTGA